MSKLSSYWWLPYTVIALWIAWVLGVIAQGRGWSVIDFSKDLTLAGQFGDAFGSLSSFMSALAATGAFLALRHQREAGTETQKVAQRQSFEGTLFHLMDSLRQKTQDIVILTQMYTETDDEGGGYYDRVELKGPDAFDKFLENLTDNIADSTKSLEDVFLADSRDQEANFSHYFRLVYHIVIYIHDHEAIPDIRDKYRYLRLLRAQMSAPEMLTVLLNCLYGGGREKFLLLASDYDFFQHVRESDGPIARQVRDLIPIPADTVVKLQNSQAVRRVTG